MKIIIWVFVLFVCAFVDADSALEKIKILDTKEFKSVKIDGIKVTEISDLAFHDGILYGLSDQGFLYTFDLVIKDKKIIKIQPKTAVKLQPDGDAEGLKFVDGRLLVSFERKPRVEFFSLSGKREQKVKIAKKLRHIKNYRSKNKALEAVTYNKKYGVVTAPELPLKNKDICHHTIFTQRGNFDFKASGSITALEFIDDDKVLVLLRDYSYWTRRLVITLISVDFSNGDVKSMLQIDSRKDDNIDNFEGLTKISDNLYLMVSDDNESIFQKTLFVLFEIL